MAEQFSACILTLRRRRTSSLYRSHSDWPIYSEGVEEFEKLKKNIFNLSFNANDHTHDDLTIIVAEVFIQV